MTVIGAPLIILPQFVSLYNSLHTFVDDHFTERNGKNLTELLLISIFVDQLFRYKHCCIGADLFWVGFPEHCFMQDQNVACRRTCAQPSRNLASTRGDGKCRVDVHEIHTFLYNMTITWRVKRSVKRSEQSYVLETVYPSRQLSTRPHFVLPVHKTDGRVSA